ncbi:MAG: hypothetical protein DLM73_05750 [Chthoniobacterales bacterium]|nr:MAG: hypothetical protein DLM73_05750 [Chthoniobacterales bacterium]
MDRATVIFEVSRLSTAERLQAMEWLWASLSKEAKDIQSPEWPGGSARCPQGKDRFG